MTFDTAADLDRKMLAVVVKADQPELFTILRTLFHVCTDAEDTDEIDLSKAPAGWEHLEKFDLAQVARILKLEEYVSALEIEQLLDVMTFLDVEKAIVRGL